MPAPALLLGHLELELAFVVLRPTELVEPSVGVGLDRIVAIEIDQQHKHRSGQRGLQVDLAVHFEHFDVARRLRIDQSRVLLFGKLRSYLPCGLLGARAER